MVKKQYPNKPWLSLVVAVGLAAVLAVIFLVAARQRANLVPVYTSDSTPIAPITPQENLPLTLPGINSGSTEPTGSATATPEQTTAPDTSALVAEGDAVYNRKDYLTATIHYQAALSINPDQASVWVKLGNSQRDRGELETSLASYKKAREVDSRLGDSYLNAAAVLWQQDKKQEAIELLTAGLAANASRANDLKATLEVYEALR